ncbi:unnamed protein product [Trichobilharzia regenti]|nr:unnamed protein product [Trichobilharzia regenti]
MYDRLIQAVFGHSDIVTCLARSECHFSQYYYLASGSRDCTVMLWMFSMQRLCVVTSQGTPKPVVILNGHEASIKCISLSAELGLVLSGSVSYLLGQFDHSWLSVYTLNGKLLHSNDLGILSNNTNSSIVYHINAMLFSDCGRYILVAGNDGVIWILRSYNLLPVHAFPKCDTSVESLSLSHDQR